MPGSLSSLSESVSLLLAGSSVTIPAFMKARTTVETDTLAQASTIHWPSRVVPTETLCGLLYLAQVFSLTLAFLSTGQSYTEPTEQTSNSCYAMCPAGYHKVGDCVDRAGQYICKKCGNAEYTEVPNLIPKCQRCDSCSHIEKEIKPCTFNSNVVCDCKDGYYDSNPNPHIRNCQARRSTRCGGR
ncbi:tumor necrosis factor receptor superfamily member 1B-like [Micropterus dolomieu]|uniref:tumor necrosis factor receptor superfamily member 1B-like n=1 Tax=Micropterus dolomieu TaxID=147949 RepID=UPI001E8E5A0D|nr:tumor necrosis factor receptor superfamily member 1B-like [Micropterus dolomieu]